VKTIALVAAIAALSSPPAAVLSASGTPIRHLVYDFSYGVQQSARAHDADVEGAGGSGFNGQYSSGSSNYGGSLGDKGTMTVDVMSEQPDKGLVVSISEQGENTRKALPATCVVYGNTSVICDPNATVNPEEYTLLRFLASNFVDPGQIDAKQHWSVTQNGGGTEVRADYTIQSNDNGVMTIGETRSIVNDSRKSTTTNVQTKILYDFSRLLPTSVDEYVTQRVDAGMSGTSTTIYQTTLKLASDSMAKPQ